MNLSLEWRQRISLILFQLVLCFCKDIHNSLRKDAENFHEKQEALYSFSRPTAKFPLSGHWNLGGGATLKDGFVQLTHGEPSQSGLLVHSKALEMESWELTAFLRFRGVSSGVGQGFAIWYTETPVEVGDFFGGKSVWKGLGIFVQIKDKYRITLIYNDGTEEYSEVKIRSAQHKCTVSHWANKNVVTADIKVSKNSLGTVDVKVNNKKLVEESKKFNPCIIGAPVEVPAGYHLGFSASTGRGSDKHDIFGVQLKNTHQLHKSSHAVKIDKKHPEEKVEEFKNLIQQSAEEEHKREDELHADEFEGEDDVEEHDQEDHSDVLAQLVSNMDAMIEQLSALNSPTDKEQQERSLRAELKNLNREVADFKVSVQRAAPVLRINSATTRINDIAQIIETIEETQRMLVQNAKFTISDEDSSTQFMAFIGLIAVNVILFSIYYCRSSSGTNRGHGLPT